MPVRWRNIITKLGCTLLTSSPRRWGSTSTSRQGCGCLMKRHPALGRNKRKMENAEQLKGANATVRSQIIFVLNKTSVSTQHNVNKHNMNKATMTYLQSNNNNFQREQKASLHKNDANDCVRSEENSQVALSRYSSRSNLRSEISEPNLVVHLISSELNMLIEQRLITLPQG